MAGSENILEHIGIAKRSGRYPWGSGGTPQQRAREFKVYIEEMRAQGLKDTEIAQGLSTRDHKVSTTDIRQTIALATEQIRADNVMTARKLRDKQMSNIAIAEQMGLGKKGESTVRGWLKESETLKENSIRATANVLKQNLDEKPFLDVGKGTEHHMNISNTKLNNALALLRDEGYEVHGGIKLPQLGTDKMTEYKILTQPGVSWKEAREALMQGRVQNITEHSDDGGLSYFRPDHNPVSVSSKRVDVRYGDQGGNKMDGVIELRRGVPDLDLGASNYAQVRVAVDGTHYLKGMAMYADDLPAGVDIRFNTNKTKAEAPSKLDTMKPLKDDPSNRFGATTHPKVYIDKDGKEKTSALNIVNEEGRWDEWSRSLSSQMLSKQSVKLAGEQLNKTRNSKKQELDEILSLTNPVVKKKLLEEFSDSADSAAVHLKAAAMDRQSSHVILPISTVRPNEIYAPNFTHGEKVVLIRYPHGGPFEIPQLTVNNRNLTAKRILGGNAKDAVGIHHTVAEQLSGADFDGDAVLVIPNNDGRVKTQRPLKDLEGFDAKVSYKIPEGSNATKMTKANTQTEMGKISNLITDMTIKRAPDDELARAVKHSMVVIDAEKHGLDYKRSAQDHMISYLKTKYQGGPTKGAATIISRASSDASVPQRKAITGDRGIDPKTGERLYKETGASYVDAKGKTIEKITKGTKMEFAKDARELLSDNPEPMEEIYAYHANSMKALANEARKQSVALKMPAVSPAAKAVYAKEVASLNAKLQEAQRNAPLERRAQIIGNAVAKARIDENPQYEKDDIKRVKYQELENARIATGASKKKIGTEANPLTEREWEAIQAGAISHTKLSEILRNADKERIKTLATPRARTSLTPGQLAKAQQMLNSGRPMSEIADALGIPRSTIADNLARK